MLHSASLTKYPKLWSFRHAFYFVSKKTIYCSWTTHNLFVIQTITFLFVGYRIWRCFYTCQTNTTTPAMVFHTASTPARRLSIRLVSAITNSLREQRQMEECLAENTIMTNASRICNFLGWWKYPLIIVQHHGMKRAWYRALARFWPGESRPWPPFLKV